MLPSGYQTLISHYLTYFSQCSYRLGAIFTSQLRKLRLRVIPLGLESWYSYFLYFPVSFYRMDRVELNLRYEVS